MKKIISIMLVVVFVLSMVGCNKSSSILGEQNTKADKEESKAMNGDELKIGFVFPAESDAPDTEARLKGIRKMQVETGLKDSQIEMKLNISKEQSSDDIKKLADDKCKAIFVLGARYEDDVLTLAEQYPDIQFCQEAGKKTIDSELDNIHTFNSKIYQSYYISGVIAGMKLNALLDEGRVSGSDCRVGFVAYKEGTETNCCINAFYLGIKEVCSQATIDVRYVGSRGVYDDDGECARQLAVSGVSMMCQYTFTSAVATVCAEYDLPLIGNEENMISAAPSGALTSVTTDWSIYYTEVVKALIDGKSIEKDWCGGYAEGVTSLSQLNDKHIADGTVEKVIELEDKMRDKKIKVFDATKVMVGEQPLETAVKDNPELKKMKKYVKNGEFKEQSKSSYPKMSFLIDGVNISTEDYIAEQAAESTTESEE